MKKVFRVALLTLLVANGAAAAQYALDNENIAVTFNQDKSALTIKDKADGGQLAPQELFFLTLPDETVIHAADFTLQSVSQQGRR
ncbi:Uncharacterised protein [Serratia rubidaea]|uniref:Uncharacterized protein n=1 Tax=Serratia rubidaea TaxID=61652 RepID=A0A4V6JHC9_SERRU|nr:Uncharacterised protein [Serratia rubidaea]